MRDDTKPFQRSTVAQQSLDERTNDAQEERCKAAMSLVRRSLTDAILSSAIPPASPHRYEPA